MRVPSRGLNLGEHLHLGGSRGKNQIQKLGKGPGNCAALEGSERRFEEGRQKEQTVMRFCHWRGRMVLGVDS